MKCLITGVTGFAASHLAEHLLNLGHTVHGTHRIRASFDNVTVNGKLLPITFHAVDINDAYGVTETIKNVQPDYIFHLAAQSFVGWAWKFPEETLRTNIFGTLNVLEAVKNHCPVAVVHIASSSQVYGAIPENEQPMGLRTRFNPMNPYDTSKLAQDMLALQYFNSYKMRIIRTRAFNIAGPRRGDSFAETSWAKQIAQIEKTGKPGVIRHGNLDSFRDYVDVRDVVKAYAHLAFNGTPGEVYILGSGVPVQMKALLEKLVSLSPAEISLSVDQSRMRPSDTPFMAAGDSCLKEIVGETIPFEKTMDDLLNYWRDKLK